MAHFLCFSRVLTCFSRVFDVFCGRVPRCEPKKSPLTLSCLSHLQVIEFDDGSGSVLRIQPLRTPRDEAIYECVASNSVGETSATTRLTVLRGRSSPGTLIEQLDKLARRISAGKFFFAALSHFCCHAKLAPRATSSFLIRISLLAI